MFGIMFGGFVLSEFWLALLVLLALWAVADLIDRALEFFFPDRAGRIYRVRVGDEILELNRFGEVLRRAPAKDAI